MKYQAPQKLNDSEIIAILKSTESTQSMRIDAVLSALYYGSTNEFAGDVLLDTFKKASKEEKYWLKNQFSTFYGMCRTNYRIDESINLMCDFQKDNPEWALEMNDLIEELKERKIMYKDYCPVQSSKPE